MIRVHNRLPLFLDCMRRWERAPNARVFRMEYADPMRDVAGDFFEDFAEWVADLPWAEYRRKSLQIDPEKEESRLRSAVRKVEELLRVPLEGDAILLSTFESMDGYARFEGGTHRVYLGVDENHLEGRYLDVLMTHELTHVAREPRPEVWKGWGLSLPRSNREFCDTQPVLEHVFSEGLSCAISEALVPGEDPWLYVYQDRESYQRVLDLGPSIDERIHAEIRASEGDYGSLYDLSTYSPKPPALAHYVWAWQWVRELIREKGADPASLVSICSKDLLESALDFRLTVRP